MPSNDRISIGEELRESRHRYAGLLPCFVPPRVSFIHAVEPTLVHAKVGIITLKAACLTILPTMKFDATDPKFQKSPEYPPDKASLYKYPPERAGWVIAHNALRSEIRDILECLDALSHPLEAWEVNALRQVLKIHLECVHAHHHHEDDIFVPELDRFEYPEKVRKDFE